MGKANFPEGKPRESILWDRPMLERFKAEYAKQHNRGPHDTFTFDGHELVIGYAKYLIEYLETQLGE
jgi:hypothetical protein